MPNPDDQIPNTGKPLGDDVKSKMEESFGADFSDVRVHKDSNKPGLHGSLGAQAYTIGQHIFFSPGQYNPGESFGRKLIAHELTHVVQQGGNGSKSAEEEEAQALKAAEAKLCGQMAASGQKAPLHSAGK